MSRPGRKRDTPARWTGDDVAESYAELAELEPLRRPEEDVVAREGDTLELVATAEGREGEGPRGRELPRARAPVPDAGRADAETYAVLPELDLLTGMLETTRVEAPRDDLDEEPAQGTGVAAT